MDNILRILQSSPLLCITLPFLVFISIFFSRINRRRLPYPPGPKGYPIIGNMTMMDQLTHRGLARLSKLYGGLLHLKMGAVHFVVVSNPDMAREVLHVQDSVFSNRAANIATTYLTYNRADMAFANNGPFWRQMRKLCVMKLFSRRRAESWASVREEVDATVKIVTARIGSEVNIGELVFAMTKNIIYRAAFGSVSHEGQEEFVKIMQEFSKLFGAFNIADFLPWLGWIHAREFNKRLARARESLDAFIDVIIDDHMEKKKNVNGEDEKDEAADTDMVDQLLEFYVKDRDGENNSLQLTSDNIKAVIMVNIYYSLYIYIYKKFNVDSIEMIFTGCYVRRNRNCGIRNRMGNGGIDEETGRTEKGPTRTR